MPTYDSIEKEIIAACIKRDFEVRIDEKKNYFSDMNTMQRRAEILRFEDMNFTKSEFSLILKCMIGNGSDNAFDDYEISI